MNLQYKGFAVLLTIILMIKIFRKNNIKLANF